jgi:hypothetical protein
MDKSEFTPRRNKGQVGELIQEVGVALAPFVESRMSARYGPAKWRDRAAQAINGNPKARQVSPLDFELDPYNLLKLLRSNDPAFSSVLGKSGESLASSLMTARHRWAHEPGITVADAFHAFDTACRLFELIGHAAPEASRKRDFLRSMLAGEAAPGPGAAGDERRRQSEEPRETAPPPAADGWDPAGPAPACPPGQAARSAGDEPSIRGALAAGALVMAFLALLAAAPQWLGERGARQLPQAPEREPAAQAPQPTATQSKEGKSNGGGRQPARAPAARPDPAAENAPPTVVAIREAASPEPPPQAADDRAGAAEPPAPEAPPPAAVPPPSAPAPRPSSLVVNGDFSEHWGVGWEKHVADPTQGSFSVSVRDGMLHMLLEGRNAAQVWQSVRLPEGRGLSGLVLEAGVKMVPRRAGMLGLAPPVETGLAVQFLGPSGDDRGTIVYTQFATTGLENSGLAGVPGAMRATGRRCQLPLGEGYNRIMEMLDLKVKDCLAEAVSGAASVLIAGWMRTSNAQSSAEGFLDDVRLYYR